MTRNLVRYEEVHKVAGREVERCMGLRGMAVAGLRVMAIEEHPPPLPSLGWLAVLRIRAFTERVILYPN